MLVWRNRILLIFGTILAAFMILLPFISSRSLNSPLWNNAEKKAENKHSYSLLVDLGERKIYLLDNGKQIKSYRCAVGKPSTPSPLGCYSIVQKARWGEGFGGFWMGIDCPWGKFGMHGTTKPDTIGTAASHGCFRMKNSDAEELYDLVPYGTPVLIVDGSYGPFGKGFRSIGPGTYGLDIQVIQKRLGFLKYYRGPCNGRYDAPGFLSAVHKYQQKNGLPVSNWINKKMAEKLGFVFME